MRGHMGFLGEKRASLRQPGAGPAGRTHKAVQAQDAALGQRQQACWRLLAHLLR